MSTQGKRSNNLKTSELPPSPRGKRGAKSPPQSPRSPRQQKKTVTTNDERFKEYKGKKPEELRQMRKEAIDELDIEKAEEIDLYLSTTTTEENGDVLEEYKRWLTDCLSDTFCAYDDNVAEADNQFRNDEIEVRQSINDAYEHLRKTHLLELRALEVERETAHKRDSNKVSLEEKTFKDQARRLASCGDYNAAKTARQKAEDQHKKDQEAMIKSVDAKFDKQRDILLAKHRSELNIIKEKLQNLLNEIETTHDEEVAKHMKIAKANIRNCVQKACVDASHDINDSRKRSNTNNTLVQFVNSEIRAQKRPEFLI